MAELIQMTKDEWLAKGKQLFGENTDEWKFVCPGCGHIQAIEDFRQYKEQGATPNSATIECIGRYSSGRKWLSNLLSQPCDYAGYGLLNICPIEVIGEDKPIYSFAFAHPGELEPVGNDG